MVEFGKKSTSNWLIRDYVCEFEFAGIHSGLLIYQEFKVTIIAQVIHIHHGSEIIKWPTEINQYVSKDVHGSVFILCLIFGKDGESL